MLDIVVPVYNEGKQILKLLDEIDNEISAKKRIIVVYDFELDSTVDVVKEHANKYHFPISLVLNCYGEGALNACVCHLIVSDCL